MCGLFGFTTYGNNGKNYTELLQALATFSTERGHHASGISYILDNKLITYKKAVSGNKLKPLHLDGVQAITGHTRHATQGDYKLNYNNHPFSGTIDNVDIAIAHNGIIYNDAELQCKHKLTKSRITTDSYVYLQLLEKQKQLDFDGIRRATEELKGYYTFTILDAKNNLFFVKGDSPLSLVHIPELKIFIYASTDEILYNSLMSCGMFEYIKQNKHEDIKISEGDILKIDYNGKISKGNFEPYKTSYSFKNWYDYEDITDDTTDEEYKQLLFSTAEAFGYDAEEIEELLQYGYCLEDIEDYIYGGDLY